MQICTQLLILATETDPRKLAQTKLHLSIGPNFSVHMVQLVKLIILEATVYQLSLDSTVFVNQEGV